MTGPASAGRAQAPVARRLADSLLSPGRRVSVEEYLGTLSRDDARMSVRTDLVPLTGLRDWAMCPDELAIRHRAGKFFSVEGIKVDMNGPLGAASWEQPIIVQPEVGLLGILAREIDGVLHFLMQNKAEPGNRNGIQVSPTVQATRSNFTRVHGGRAIPYLNRFLDPAGPPHRVLTDVRQSEHGSWFLRKRNRNVVIEIFDDIDVLDGFEWLTLGQIAALTCRDDLLNMETRSVLSCLPWHTESGNVWEGDADEMAGAVRRSWSAAHRSLHSDAEVRSWVSRVRCDHEVTIQRRPLRELAGWDVSGERISRPDGRFFKVIGVRAEAVGREIASWDQPMVSAGDQGVVGLLVARPEGVLHALVRLRPEGGQVDGPEIAPTLQCTPANYPVPPPYFAEVLDAPPESVWVDVMLSDEGGRFYRISHRHLVVEVESLLAERPGYRWLTLRQLSELSQHTNYVNVQTRSLLACVQGLAVSCHRCQAPAGVTGSLG